MHGRTQLIHHDGCCLPAVAARLHDAGITPYWCGEIAYACRANQHLGSLDLSWNEFGGEAGCSDLASAIAGHRGLRRLVLDNNDLLDGLSVLACAVGRCVSLQTLSLRNVGFNELAAPALTAVVDALASSRSLRVLDVSGNLSPVWHIRATEAHRTHLGAEGMAHSTTTPSLVALLARSLPHGAWSRTLSDLRLMNSDIDDGHVCLLAEQLTAAGDNTSLEHLSLANNCFGAAGAAALGDLLKVNCRLQSLDVAGNDLLAEGAISLCSALPLNRGLKRLSLADTGLQGGATRLIADCVLASTALVSLSLSGNDLCSTREGVQHIARLVRHRDPACCLRELHLCGHDQAGGTTVYGHLAPGNGWCVGPQGVACIIARLRNGRAADATTALHMVDLRANGGEKIPQSGEGWSLYDRTLRVDGCTLRL